MARVTWTAQGLDDLDAICLFIARDSPRFAGLFAQQVFQAVERLVDFPRMGRVVPELGRDSVRELLVRSYRLIYVLSDNDDAVIITLHHGTRSLENFSP